MEIEESPFFWSNNKPNSNANTNNNTPNITPISTPYFANNSLTSSPNSAFTKVEKDSSSSSSSPETFNNPQLHAMSMRKKFSPNNSMSPNMNNNTIDPNIWLNNVLSSTPKNITMNNYNFQQHFFNIANNNNLVIDSVSSTTTSPNSIITDNNKNIGGSSCHQCKIKQKQTELIYCNPNGGDGTVNNLGISRSCRKKYCQVCLLKYYLAYEVQQLFINPITFICPSCKGICNCAACKRKRMESSK